MSEIGFGREVIWILAGLARLSLLLSGLVFCALASVTRWRRFWLARPHGGTDCAAAPVIGAGRRLKFFAAGPVFVTIRSVRQCPADDRQGA